MLGEERTEAILRDFRAVSDLAPKLRATLVFLEKMTLEPEALTDADARAVRDAGTSERELIDAIYVAGAFNIYDRLADALGWHVPQEAEAYREMAKILLRVGYR